MNKSQEVNRKRMFDKIVAEHRKKIQSIRKKYSTEGKVKIKDIPAYSKEVRMADMQFYIAIEPYCRTPKKFINI